MTMDYIYNLTKLKSKKREIDSTMYACNPEYTKTEINILINQKKKKYEELNSTYKLYIKSNSSYSKTLAKLNETIEILKNELAKSEDDLDYVFLNKCGIYKKSVEEYYKLKKESEEIDVKINKLKKDNPIKQKINKKPKNKEDNNHKNDSLKSKCIKDRIDKKSSPLLEFPKIDEQILDIDNLIYYEEDKNIYCLDYYYPTNKPPEQEEWDKRILNLKAYDTYINFFAERILNILTIKDGSYTICRIPRAKSTGPDNMAKIAKIITKNLNDANNNIINGAECLYRYKDSEYSHLGHREKDKHLKSIKIINKEKIDNKKVLLLDDIVTKKQSMIECMILLYGAGAKEVIGIGLGRTHRYNP